MGDAAVIGLISDTHGLMRQEALAILKGVDLIIHAGDVGKPGIIEQLRDDVGKPGIIEQLRAVAPVVAVRGNIDQGAWASQLPLTAVAQGRSALIYVLHDIQQLGLDPVAAEFNIVVCGHSHKPGHTERSGVMFLNPGSAGPRRFRLPITVARLDLRRSPWSVEFIDLSNAGKWQPIDAGT